MINLGDKRVRLRLRDYRSVLKLHEVPHGSYRDNILLVVVIWRCIAAVITVLLSMTVFQLIIAENVPESSHAVPLIGTSHGATAFSLRERETRD